MCWAVSFGVQILTTLNANDGTHGWDTHEFSRAGVMCVCIVFIRFLGCGRAQAHIKLAWSITLQDVELASLVQFVFLPFAVHMHWGRSEDIAGAHKKVAGPTTWGIKLLLVGPLLCSH